MNCNIVTEGPTDAAILRCLLQPEIATGNAQVISAGGRSSAVSLTRTLLVSRDGHVALVADADTTVRERVDELIRELDQSLGAVSRAGRFMILLAEPTIETWLFFDIDGLKKLFGEALSDEFLLESRYEPKAVLEKLCAVSQREYSAESVPHLLHELNIETIRSAPALAELVEFVAEATQASPV